MCWMVVACLWSYREGVAENEHILYFWQTDPRMVASWIAFTKNWVLMGQKSLHYKYKSINISPKVWITRKGKPEKLLKTSFYDWIGAWAEWDWKLIDLAMERSRAGVNKGFAKNAQKTSFYDWIGAWAEWDRKMIDPVFCRSRTGMWRRLYKNWADPIFTP